MKLNLIAFLAAGLASAATGAAADAVENAVKARQGQMQIIAMNIGVLGNMARGRVDYDATAAQTAADSLAGIAMVNQVPLWIEGSTEMDIDGTRAQANIVDDLSGFLEKWQGFQNGAMAMQAVAGTGLEAVQGAMGGVGASCAACHDVYRAPAS